MTRPSMEGGARLSPWPAANNDGDVKGTGEPSAASPYRILIVDDNRAIHEDFRRILVGARPVDPELDELASALLGVETAPPSIRWLLDSAYQGEEALATVERANEEGRPYALVFMDIRMPPGWSGVKAAARVLEVDELVHIILCTGHVGNEWRRQVEALTTSDRVLLLKKPFDPLEVRQMAKAICHKWTLALRDRRRMQELERVVSEKTSALEAANEQLRREMSERARAERELSRAQQLEGLGRLAAGLCHEINNPLTFIAGGIEAMRGAFQEVNGMLPGEKREELGELMRSVAVGADRITQIVRNVKLLSRGSDADTEIVDVNVAIDTAVEMLMPGLSPHIELLVEREQSVSMGPQAAPNPGAPCPPESRMRVRGRRLGLEQVLLNLLKNSAHALSEVAAGEAVIRVRAQKFEGNRARITVRDTGPGIPEDVIDKIFEPFFTTKPVNQGTGLGLAICHGLVSGMNGTIEVKSEPGRGTTFTITLPVAPAELAVDASLSDSSGAPEQGADSGVRGRVLILDDERFILKVMKHMLKEHDIATATSVEEALSLCVQGTFDVILSDVMMPGAGGCDFHNGLAKIRPGEEEKIVFITGGTMMEDVLAFLDSVSNPCLEKPIDPRALRALVAERLGARGAAARRAPA